MDNSSRRTDHSFAVSSGTLNLLSPDAENKRYEVAVIISLIVILSAVLIFSLMVGRFGLPLGTIIRVFAARFSGNVDAELRQAYNVLFIIRLPRIFLTLLVGAALAISGAAYQSLFRNPLVSPDILGVTHGAGVGAAIGILLGMPSVGIHLLSFLFGIGVVSIVLSLSRILGSGKNATVVLVLTGTIMNLLAQSIISFTKYVADAESKLPEITFWLMGSFARSGNYRNIYIMLVLFLIGAVPVFLLRWKINVLSFGDEEARSLGIDTKRLRAIVILCSTLLTAASVSLCGTIGWVGLIIPHISRLLVGPNNRVLFPVALLAGSTFMLIVDDFARAIVPGELPIGVLTAFVGAPLFLYMLFNGKRDWL
ncbi:MAG: iron ABC transporter permease [Treponema sp.]|nr:iron ABC transporter permease [Treponema sp.]